MRSLGDRGSAVVAAVLTLPIVVAFFVVVAQVGVVAYVHSNAAHAAAEGARAAAVSQMPAVAALQRVQTVMHQTSGVSRVDKVTTTAPLVFGVPVIHVVVTVSVPTVWITGRHTVRASATVIRELAP
jgi:hypothetical protein